ncbi:hypothetical protein OF83DRAFT_1167890 [Amylostereum chailletii]|nr:hypothetical protein OF83DRAFT_1167890 [Amylostereum chailletii]
MSTKGSGSTGKPVESLPLPKPFAGDNASDATLVPINIPSTSKQAVPTTDPDQASTRVDLAFAETARERGWATSTPTRASLGGM